MTVVLWNVVDFIPHLCLDYPKLGLLGRFTSQNTGIPSTYFASVSVSLCCVISHRMNKFGLNVLCS